MFLSTFQGTVASVALGTGLSLVTILQAEDWANVSNRHYFTRYVTTPDWYQDSVQCVVLALSE